MVRSGSFQPPHVTSNSGSRGPVARPACGSRAPLDGTDPRPPRVGDLSPARDPGADRALSRRSRTAPGLRCRPADALDRYRTSDDRAVEALLASVHEPCTAHQLACGLRWTLERTIDALRRLEANLANTQTVKETGHQHLHARTATRAPQRPGDCPLLAAQPRAARLHCRRGAAPRAHMLAGGPRPRGAHRPRGACGRCTADRCGAARGRPRLPPTNAPGRSDVPGNPPSAARSADHIGPRAWHNQVRSRHLTNCSHPAGQTALISVTSHIDVGRRSNDSRVRSGGIDASSRLGPPVPPPGLAHPSRSRRPVPALSRRDQPALTETVPPHRL